MTLAIARDLGWKTLEIRVGFAADMAARNAQRTKEAALKSEPSSLTSTYPSTIRLFDEDPRRAFSMHRSLTALKWNLWMIKALQELRGYWS